MAVGSRVMVSPDSDDDFIAVTDDMVVDMMTRSLSDTDDMVVDITLQPDHDREQTLAFKYVNKDLPMPDCVGVILAQKGQIVYCGVAGATPWHGSFESVAVGPRSHWGIILKFHCSGDGNWRETWQECRVRQNGDGIWRGIDYRGRKVEMTPIPPSHNWFRGMATTIQALTATVIAFEARHLDTLIQRLARTYGDCLRSILWYLYINDIPLASTHVPAAA